jgi:hypothetical protein
MLLMLCGSFLLCAVSVCLGYAASSKLGLLAADDLAGNVFGSYWIGLSILMVAATTAACIGPVGRLGPLALIAVLAAALAVQSVRQLIAESIRVTHPGTAAAAFSGVALLSLLAVFGHNCHDGRPCLADSGFYHTQIIRWYSDYGATPGMALLHHRLGFHSGLYAVAALLDHGMLTGRSGSVVTLSAVAVSLWFVAVAISRWRTKPLREVLFWPVFVIVAVSAIETTLVSDYPDTLLFFFVGAVFRLAWMWWERGVGRSARWALILLGAGAMNIKFSGLLLLGLVLVISLLMVRISALALLAHIGFCLLLTAPVFVIQGITSGHPLYPAVALALPVDWAAPGELVNASRNDILRFAMFGGGAALPVTMEERARNILGGRSTFVIGVAAVLLLSAGLAWRRASRDFAVVFAIALAGVGLIQLIQVPAIRFTLGYLMVLPALVIADHPKRLVLGLYAAALAFLLICGVKGNRLELLRLAFYVCVVAWTAVAAFKRRTVRTTILPACLIVGQFIRPIATVAAEFPTILRDPFWVLVPRTSLVLSGRELTDAVLGEVKYEQPADRFHCWAAAPPCAPFPYQANLGAIKALQYRCGPDKLGCGFRAKGRR